MGEGPTTNKENIACIKLHKILLRMFAPGVGWHICRGAFNDLEQRLLYPFTTDIARDAGVVAPFACDLVNLVDIDDPVASALSVPLGCLQKTNQNGFHILADVASFRQGGGIGDGNRHIDQARQGLGK